MKIFILLILLLSILIIASCTNKDVDFYKKDYLKHKTEYLDAKDRLEYLLTKDTLIFKIMIEFTGKRLVYYQYINDGNIHLLNYGSFSEDNMVYFDNMMYKQHLLYIEAYRDSIKYTFNGKNKDIIVNYCSSMELYKGNLIDTNTFVIFESNNSKFQP